MKSGVEDNGRGARPRRRRLLRHGILWVVLVWVAFQLFGVLAFRLQLRPVIDAVRSFNKNILRPPMMKLAGRRHWYAAVIRHKGRRSGKEYATPIWAEPTEGGFVVPLPYGERVDWLKNILAVGQCRIEAKGVAYEVGDLEVVDASIVGPMFPPLLRFLFRLYGVRSYLRTRTLAISPEQVAAHGAARATYAGNGVRA